MDCWLGNVVGKGMLLGREHFSSLKLGPNIYGNIDTLYVVTQKTSLSDQSTHTNTPGPLRPAGDLFPGPQLKSVVHNDIKILEHKDKELANNSP